MDRLWVPVLLYRQVWALTSFQRCPNGPHCLAVSLAPSPPGVTGTVVYVLCNE